MHFSSIIILWNYGWDDKKMNIIISENVLSTRSSLSGVWLRPTALLKLRIFATRMIFSAAISLFLCFYNINLLINFVDSYSSILSRENSRIINPSIGIPFFHKKITHLSKSRVSDVEEIIQNIIEKKNICIYWSIHWNCVFVLCFCTEWVRNISKIIIVFVKRISVALMNILNAMKFPIKKI